MFYVSLNYAYEILRPLQEVILRRGDHCAWFLESKKIDEKYLREGEHRLHSIDEVKAYKPDAVFVPGNMVPNFIPGIKVQVFHGLEWKKKGHFRIRGFFDLYCTHGPITTDRFEQLAKEHRYFRVVETGWPKLDPLFQVDPYPVAKERSIILYAPTFSPSLCSAIDLFPEIQRLVKTRDWYWLVKFHPKMNPEWIQMYQQLSCDNFEVVETDSALPVLRAGDVLVSDTSSIIGEYFLQGRPVVTYKNSAPGGDLIDINDPALLEPSIERALEPNGVLKQAIVDSCNMMHPYRDGLSSERVLQATDDMIDQGLKGLRPKPLNLWRSLRIRKRLNYWKI